MKKYVLIAVLLLVNIAPAQTKDSKPKPKKKLTEEQVERRRGYKILAATVAFFTGYMIFFIHNETK